MALRKLDSKLENLLQNLNPDNSKTYIYKNLSPSDLRRPLSKNGCRSVAYHLFATLSNPYDDTNTHFPNTDIIVTYINDMAVQDTSPHIRPNCFDTDNTVIVFSLFIKYIGMHYYAALHTFIAICIRSTRFKILQSWDTAIKGQPSFSLEELSTDWIDKSPIILLNTFLDDQSIKNWETLFTSKTTQFVFNPDGSPKFTNISAKCAISKIHPSWYS
jgi:hypothetical protein